MKKSDVCELCFMGDRWTPNPGKTNGDRFRAMTDEELAEYHATYECGYCKIKSFCSGFGYARDCQDVWLDWLRKKVTE